MGKKVARVSQASSSDPSEGSARTSKAVKCVEEMCRAAIKKIAIGRIAGREPIQDLCTGCLNTLDREIALLERKGDPSGIKDALIGLQSGFSEEKSAVNRPIADSKKGLTAMAKSAEAVYHRTKH